jgi:phenylacetate-CoA ligase
MKVADLYFRLPVAAQNLACSWAGRKRYRSRYTHEFEQSLAFLESSGEAPIETLHALQQDRLVALANRARAVVPHYRALCLPAFDAASDPTAGIRAILDEFPVLEKRDYRADPESFLAEDVGSERLLKGTTSGTTGTALPLWHTRRALAEEYATVWRLRRRNGARLGDPHATFGGQLICPLEQSKPPFWRSNRYGRQTLFSLYHMTRENLPSYVDALQTLPVSYIEGYPSSLHLVALAMLEAGRTLAPGRLLAVFPSSESLLAYHRRDIEAAFGAPVRDRYGTSEFVVSMTGCSARRLHLDMEFGIAEIDVVEETDEYERGPLLVTGFANDATPFFRYRIGDVGTRSKSPCPCGRPGEVFLDVDGRLEDYVVTPDGRWVGRMDHIFKEQLDVAEAQILQTEASAIEVLIVPRPRYSRASEFDLIREIRSRLGDEIRIELCLVNEIPREPNGKFRAVKSSVGRQPRV